MARACAQRLGPTVHAGLVVAPPGHGPAPAGYRLLEAAHPVPDARSQRAADAVLDFVARPTPADALWRSPRAPAGSPTAPLRCPPAAL